VSEGISSDVLSFIVSAESKAANLKEEARTIIRNSEIGGHKA